MEVILHNGVHMPMLGLGVYKAQAGSEVENAVLAALDAGYRAIDTASLYGNEEGVGRAIKQSGIPRDHIFLTTKVWNTDQGYEQTLQAFEKSRTLLNVDVVDLYLIHWAVEGKYKETWRALEKLYKDGFVRAIGVSNFQIHHLKEIMNEYEIKPMVNQVELHPYLSQESLRQFCKEQAIQIEAWSPLMRGKLLQNETLHEIANRYGKTPAQVILRWDIQHGIVTIPKSVHKERIKENAAIFDFALTDEEMSMIDQLNQNERVGRDPDRVDF